MVGKLQHPVQGKLPQPLAVVVEATAECRVVALLGHMDSVSKPAAEVGCLVPG